MIMYTNYIPAFGGPPFDGSIEDATWRIFMIGSFLTSSELMRRQDIEVYSFTFSSVDTVCFGNA